MSSVPSFCTLRPAEPVSRWSTWATKVRLVEPKARIDSMVVVPADTCLPPTRADATPGAAIYYTTNGAAPSPASTRYTAPIPISMNVTIKAMAVAKDFPKTVFVSSSGGGTAANVGAFRWRFGRALSKDAPLDGASAFAAVSLASWILVLLAGRFIAYL